jgi:hypothetical protein
LTIYRAFSFTCRLCQGRAYRAEMPLAEGVMWETMDLRRSVIVNR